MLVSDVMSRDVFTVPSDMTVADGLARADQLDIHHLLVVKDERLSGVLCVCELRERRSSATLERCITRPPTVIWPQASLDVAVQRFVEKQVSCLPVCDGAAVVGVLTRSDLRRSTISESMLPGSFRCIYCGSTRHVRPLRGDTSAPACLDCFDRTVASDPDTFDEGGKG